MLEVLLKFKYMQKNPACFINQERTFTILHCSEQRLEVSDVGRTLHPTVWCLGILTREIIMGDILPNLRVCILTKKICLLLCFVLVILAVIILWFL